MLVITFTFSGAIFQKLSWRLKNNHSNFKGISATTKVILATEELSDHSNFKRCLSHYKSDPGHRSDHSATLKVISVTAKVILVTGKIITATLNVISATTKMILTNEEVITTTLKVT